MSMKVLLAFSLCITCCVSCYARPFDTKSLEKFFERPRLEQLDCFAKLNVEDQFRVYIYGSEVIQPHALYLARTYAEEGEKVVPFLKKKLEHAQKGITVRDIAQVFSEMTQLNFYDASADKELIALLEGQAKALGGVWVGTTFDIIDRIKESGRGYAGRPEGESKTK